MRWLVLLAFFPAVTGTPIDSIGNDMRVAFAIGAVACAFLLTRLGRSAANSLWVWIILFVFIDAYYFLSWIIAYDLAGARRLTLRYSEVYWLTPSVIADGMPWITLSFVVFCATAWILLGSRATAAVDAAYAIGDRPKRQRLTIPIGFVVFSVAVIAEMLRAYLGVGIAGQENPALPLYFGTILTRLSIDVCPGVTLLLIWVADRYHRRFRAWLFTSLLMLQALLFMVTSTSRGGLVRFAIPLAFLWILANRMTTRRIAFMGAVLVATVVLFSFISALRVALVTQQTGVSVTTIQQTAEYHKPKKWSDVITNSAMLVATRATGVDSIWFATHAIPPRFSLHYMSQFIFPESLSTFFTDVVVGNVAPGDHRAPGLVGTFMLLGGRIGVVVFMIAYLAIVRIVWSLLLRLKTAPVALAIFGQALLAHASDGGIAFQNLYAAIIVALMNELLYSVVITRASRALPSRHAPVSVPRLRHA